MMIDIPVQLHNCRFIKTYEKRPYETNWTDFENGKNYDLKTLIENIKDLKNQTYGVLCGYNNLIVVDFDNKEVQDEVIFNHVQFKDTFQVRTAGKGLTHCYFYSNQSESFKALSETGDTLFDVQGKGKQVIGPGSILSNGRQYVVCNDKDIEFIDYSELKAILSKYNKFSSGKQKVVEVNNSNIKGFEEDIIIKKIKECLKVKNILTILNIDAKKNPCRCPLHDSQGGKCFSYEDDRWHCFHCDNSGTIFHLYMKAKNITFQECKFELAKLAGMSKEEYLQTTKVMREEYSKKALQTKIEVQKQKYLTEKEKELERNEYKKLKELEKVQKTFDKDKRKKELIDRYLNIPINSFTIFKSKEESMYSISISNYSFDIVAKDILTPNVFRVNYFTESGTLLPQIDNNSWAEIVNQWVREFGKSTDNTKDASTESLVKYGVLNDISEFDLTDDLAISFNNNRILVRREDPGYLYISNTALDYLIKKNFNNKISLHRLKIILKDYIDDSKVLKHKRVSRRFTMFKLGMMKEYIDVERFEYLLNYVEEPPKEEIKKEEPKKVDKFELPDDELRNYNVVEEDF